MGWLEQEIDRLHIENENLKAQADRDRSRHLRELAKQSSADARTMAAAIDLMVERHDVEIRSMKLAWKET